METIKIMDNLYLFNSYAQEIDLSFNQYLLLGKEPLLVHTGRHDLAAALVPKLREILNDRPLSYIFISHFESDECGGLSLILHHFPGAKPVCSAVTARQLRGFGITGDAMVKGPGEEIAAGDYNLQFFGYPSEMHLWEGLLAWEKEQKIFFSSDLFIRRGRLEKALAEGNWPAEVEKISVEQIPNPGAREILQRNLSMIPVKLLAPGHGPCLKL